MFLSRHTRAHFCAALFALLIGVLVIPVATASPASATEADNIYELANEARWGDGKKGLIRNAEMDAVALAWAEHMAANNDMSHNPDYSSQIPSGWRSAGENVASGYRTAEAMHEGWMSSPGHKANILGSYTDIGVAFLVSGGKTWAVQVFASYPGHVGPSAPESSQNPTESSPSGNDSGTENTSDGATGESSEISAPDSSTGSSSDGVIATTDGPTGPTLSQEELQASVYGNKSDSTWIAWVVFFGLLAAAGGGWFVFWRRPRK